MNRVNKTLSMNIEMAKRLEQEDNQSATVEAALAAYWGDDAPVEHDDLVTDGGEPREDGRQPVDTDADPTTLGYRILAVLAGHAWPTGTLVSELRAHPIHDSVSEQAVTRTCRALQETGLVTRAESREWVITADGRALERAERGWRADHAADHRLRNAEPRQQPSAGGDET